MGVIIASIKTVSEATQSSSLFGWAAFVLIAASLVYAYINATAKPGPCYLKTYKPLPVVKANNKNRKYGHWVPEQFTYPKVEPYPDWSIDETPPIPYRAFKHTYFITMGIRNMEWDSWIELDNEWHKYHNRKQERIRERDSDLYGTSPEAWDGAMELLEEFRNYLPQRYPSLFRATEKGIDNIVTGESFEFLGIPKSDFKMDPMLMAAYMVQDDLAVMVENEFGEYVLKGGAIMLAGFWRLKDKLNLPLSAIHTTGDVPKYNEKLKSGMEKFFIRQTCDKPVVRNNYFLQTDDDLAWSYSIGDEGKEVVGWYTASPATDINKIYFRSERQSVRRLPKTGVTIFTIRTYFSPIVKLCEEPYVPLRLLDGILSWEKDVQDYRGYTIFKDVLLPYLREKADEQQKMGYTQDKEPNNYPF
ncbi:hypothetical protein OGAPHI_005109 [Ogataea philodendri]|uniref:Mannosyltransferase n=1 Tax=Ogataea philodendri TaxID=1378263 RepID=A0A9P8T2C8_9ASCO|nr:uncharacterized protein OGAPHI_005109 [Ogataea philodendri]KAH3663708.1 hypothetical protein OGAPHI_005109 [Ogataea philodendri]